MAVFNESSNTHSLPALSDGKMSMANTNNPIIALDGTSYEGGGGLVRYAISYSALLNRTVRISSIRARRPGVGGLRPEHTIAVSTMACLTSAEVIGNQPASQDMTFIPRDAQPLPDELDVDVEGAASIFLIAMLPYLLFGSLASGPEKTKPKISMEAGLRLTVRAGTLCVKAPSIFYMYQVFLPTLRLVGIDTKYLDIEPDYEQGWHTENTKYPGKLVARLKPLSKPLPGFVLPHRGSLCKIQVTAHAPRHATRYLEQVLRAEMTEIVLRSEVEVKIDVFTSDPDNQWHVLIVATTKAPTAYIGYEQVYPQSDILPQDIKTQSNEIAVLLTRVCIHGLWNELRRGNAVDEHMEDIMVIYQSLASGFSSVAATNNERSVPELNMDAAAIKFASIYGVDTNTMHRQTSWWVAQEMAGVKQEILEAHDGKKQIGCQGIGLGNA